MVASAVVLWTSPACETSFVNITKLYQSLPQAILKQGEVLAYCLLRFASIRLIRVAVSLLTQIAAGRER